MQAELKNILTASDYDKYLVALNAPLKEYKTHLPTKMTTKIAENFVQFIKNKQGSHITIAYEKRLKEISDQVAAAQAARDSRPQKEAPAKNEEAKERKPRKTAVKKESAESEDPVED